MLQEEHGLCHLGVAWEATPVRGFGWPYHRRHLLARTAQHNNDREARTAQHDREARTARGQSEDGACEEGKVRRERVRRAE